MATLLGTRAVHQASDPAGGPLFMSYAVANNLQYRLSETGRNTHPVSTRPLGDLGHERGVNRGWTSMEMSVSGSAPKQRSKEAHVSMCGVGRTGS